MECVGLTRTDYDDIDSLMIEFEDEDGIAYEDDFEVPEDLGYYVDIAMREGAKTPRWIKIIFPEVAAKVENPVLPDFGEITLNGQKVTLAEIIRMVVNGEV